MKQIDLREGARRQHRALAHFAVIQCWLRKVDGICFDRERLKRLLGLERFKGTRHEWLKEDLEEFLPHITIHYITKMNNSLACVYASRLPIKEFLAPGSMTTAERLNRMPANAPRIEMFKIWLHPDRDKVLPAFQAAIPFFADAANYDERLLASYLALLSQGQISPHSLPTAD